MFGTVAIIVLLLIAVGVFIFGKRQKNIIALLASAALFVSSLTWLGFSTFYTQDPGQAVLVKSFTGEVSGVSETPGMHFKMPWESAETFNLRNQSVEMFSNDGGEGKDGSEVQVGLKGGATAGVSITVIYSLKSDAVENIYNVNRNQTGLLDNVIKPQTRAVARDEATVYTPILIREKRAEYSSKILLNLQKQLEDKGVVIEQVNIGSIRLSPETEKSIEGVVNAQQNVEATRAQLTQAELQAQITKTNAQADADADQIIRCGATIRTEKKDINGVQTDVTIVTPKSGAECENRLNEQVLTTKWFEALEAAGKNGNTIIVTPSDGQAPIIQVPKPNPAPAPAG